jgi:serine/threonine-protein kinase
VPFARDSDVGVIYAHLSEAPPRPSAARPELPDGLDTVIAKALEKAPDRRFGSCGDLMAAARAVVDAAGPLSETSPPRPVSSSVLAGMRDVAAAARRARVLLAGMDPSTRAIARVALGSGVDVRETSALGALDAARDARPDLVILPAAGAAEVVGALRADPLTRESKVLLVGDGPAPGADERLATPFSPLQLQVKLRRLLGSEAIGA